jgi:osmotically-inducible protein OsmY
MTNTIDDTELRRRVLAELDWEPMLDASAIGVAAKDGVVTLSGSVSSYAQKKNAERATKRVAGVKAVAEDLTIKLPGLAARGDADIAQSLVSALRFNVSVPADKIQVTVENGWVTLDGEVEWQYQKTTAENSIKYMMGVTGITNRIEVKPRINAGDVKSKIQSAFTRHAQLDANKIKVEATDSKVVLRGSVRSWRERQDAELAAWSAPGVSKVENDVVVDSW